MVDWSGGNSRRANQANCIWIAHGHSQDLEPIGVSPRSRTEAETLIMQLLQPFAQGDNGRVLVCFDFPYGYPRHLGLCLPPVDPPEPDLPWRRVWEYLAQHIHDDLNTPPGGQPSNVSNRFDVAAALNQMLAPPEQPGPFWCAHPPGAYPNVPQNQPVFPFASVEGHIIQALRHTDNQVHSDWPFRLFGNGSVGSQMLVGVPRVRKLRYSPALGAASVAWPFETGWAPPVGDWLAPGKRILYAEIYPSVAQPLPDPILDRGQVRAMWTWARDEDLQDQLQGHFAIPPGVQAGGPVDLEIRQQEGWILH
jgi:precorrin-8X/cobalt-precorrin-8 methylmutase